MATKTAAPKTKTYTVSAKVSAELTLDISANSWDEACAKAKELSFDDFAAVVGDANEENPTELRCIYVND